MCPCLNKGSSDVQRKYMFPWELPPMCIMVFCEKSMHDGVYDAATLLSMAPEIIAEHNVIGVNNDTRLKNDEFLGAEILFPNKEAFRRYTKSLRTESDLVLFKARACDSIDDYNASYNLINAIKMDSNMEGEKRIKKCLVTPRLSLLSFLNTATKMFVTCWSYSSYDHYMTSANWS